MNKYTHIIRSMSEAPWAIMPAKLAVIHDLMAFKAAGGSLSDEEIQAAMNTRAPGQTASPSSVAILPLVGTIIPRLNLLTESSGAVSVQGFTRQFRAALNDPDVASILIDVDSPGGQVGGVEELSAEIYNARGEKPIKAVVNTLAASAGYWLASAVDELIITPSGQAGSIGVYMMHEDVSGLLEKEGVTVSLISAGKYKTEANPFEPLTEESAAALQKSVDEYYEMFIGAVARNRGVSADTVRNGFGEGRVVGAQEAVASGMADRVATFSDVLDELITGGTGRSRRRRASFAQHKIDIEKAKRP